MKKKEIFKNLILFIITIILIAGVILPKTLNNLDELWNFNFARNIANGKLPYKDFNMVLTPLLPIICSIILKTFGTELIVMRILAILLCSIIMFLIYTILKVLNINKIIIYFLLFGMFLLYRDFFCIDYNFAVVLITLIVILLELKKDTYMNNKIDFFIGLLCGTAILFKQTTGSFLCICFLGYNILIIDNKNEWKKFLKNSIFRVLGMFIPIVCFVFYLTFNNIWYDFIDYAILGIKSFSNNISYLNLINGNYGIIISILSMLIPILLIYIYIKTVIMKMKSKEDKKLFILFVYSISSLIVIYPISDSIHFLIGILPSLVLLIYFIWINMPKDVKQRKIVQLFIEFLKSFTILLFTFCFLLYITKIYSYLKIANNYIYLQNFKYIKADEKNINEINQFILENEKNGKSVYIFDATAALYMIPLNKYNKNYDMFLKGNLGGGGEKGQIEVLKNTDNSTVILIKNNKYSQNWQNPKTVREYIINNWLKVGEIKCFDIYEKR